MRERRSSLGRKGGRCSQALRTDATNATLTLTNITRSSGGSYSLLVSNCFGTILSADARVHAMVRQDLAVSCKPDGSVLLQSGDSDGGELTSADVPFFEAWFSTSLVTWELLTNSLTLTNGSLFLTDRTAKTEPRRFYRVLKRP